MKQLLIATTALTLMCGSAFAHGTGPAQQDNMNKPALTSGKTEMGSIQVASNGKTSMKKGKKHHGKKGGMMPDASGQGGAGPGSDQGGTKVAPGEYEVNLILISSRLQPLG